MCVGVWGLQRIPWIVGVQLLQFTWNLCNFNAIQPIALQSFLILQSNCNPVWLSWLRSFLGRLCRDLAWVANGFGWIALWSLTYCENMPIPGQLGMFSCNLWISQDFGAILSILWQSFAVLQSCCNSIQSWRLRSGLPSWCFGSIVWGSSLGGFQSDCDLGQSWADLWHLVAILKQSFWIVSGLHWICNRSTIHRIAARIAKSQRTQFLGLRLIERIAEDPLGQGSNLKPRIAIQGNNRSGHNSGPIGVQSVWIASGSLKIQNPVAIIRIANIEVSIAGGLWQLKGARFGDCGAPRGLLRIPEQLPGPALQSGLRPDGQPLG